MAGLFPFDEVIATTDRTNLKGRHKAEALVERFGDRGFDYAGDSAADVHVWRHSRKAIIVNQSARRVRELEQQVEVAREFPPAKVSWGDWFGALRVHQWIKNCLIALPVVAGHHLHSLQQLVPLLVAFLAMSLCASGTYLWNDLLDLEYDRAHPRKRRRLAASGRVGITRVAGVSVVLVIAGLVGGSLLKAEFGVVLVAYIATTMAYSLFFKRLLVADMFVLAALYLLRIVGGVVVSEAIATFWLLTFTTLLFLSLAAAKRSVELQLASALGGGRLHGRGYHSEDLTVVSVLGIAAGVASCVVLGLYTHSDHVRSMYRAPEWLAGGCLVALYWITRFWLLTHRGLMHDDPVVFALRDKATWVLGAIGLGCFVLAGPIAG